MKHKHDFISGSVIWIKNEPKIKAKCIHCNRYIIFNFENNNFDLETDYEKGYKNDRDIKSKKMG